MYLMRQQQILRSRADEPSGISFVGHPGPNPSTTDPNVSLLITFRPTISSPTPTPSPTAIPRPTATPTPTPTPTPSISPNITLGAKIDLLGYVQVEWSNLVVTDSNWYIVPVNVQGNQPVLNAIQYLTGSACSTQRPGSTQQPAIYGGCTYAASLLGQYGSSFIFILVHDQTNVKASNQVTIPQASPSPSPTPTPTPTLEPCLCNVNYYGPGSQCYSECSQ